MIAISDSRSPFKHVYLVFQPKSKAYRKRLKKMTSLHKYLHSLKKKEVHND